MSSNFRNIQCILYIGAGIFVIACRHHEMLTQVLELIVVLFDLHHILVGRYSAIVILYWHKFECKSRRVLVNHVCLGSIDKTYKLGSFLF